MKSDLDQYMQEKGIDALLVFGSTQHNPAMHYFTGNAHLTDAMLIKKRGAEPVLFYPPMERDEAAGTGLHREDISGYRLESMVSAVNGNRPEALARRLRWALEKARVSGGRVALYGREEIGPTWAMLSLFQHFAPHIALIGELDDSLLLQAMATKDPNEIAHIHRIGQITIEVVGKVADLLRKAPTEKGMVLQDDGQPITVGYIRQQINLWLAQRGAENPLGTIFSIGQDAGVPHSVGKNDDIVRTGQTIVFDIYPREAGGGYFYDLTRTWCLGKIPTEVKKLYDDVREVYETLRSEVKAGALAADLQARACELFSARGHETICSNRDTRQGYVHPLGHGVGLFIHERPNFGATAKAEDTLIPGTVFTIEPGLYYPERGMGVRLEDTYVVNPDGSVNVLAEYSLDLVP